jgi:hypothetical protein
LRFSLIEQAAQKLPGALALGLSEEALGRSLLDDKAFIHEDDSVGHISRKVHLMRHHQHCHSVLGEIAHYCEHLADKLGIERMRASESKGPDAGGVPVTQSRIPVRAKARHFPARFQLW